MSTDPQQLSDVHQLILVHGVEGAKSLARSKLEINLIDAASAMMAEEQASMGVTHAGFALTSLPHKSIDKAKDPDFHRKENGRCTLIIQSGRRADGSLFGVPFGARARMILLFLQTEALRKNSRKVELGSAWYAWIKAMGERPGGNTYRLVTEQAQRISACSLQFMWESETTSARQNSGFVKNSVMFRPQGDGKVLPLFPEVVELEEAFYESLQQHAVPVNEHALKFLTASSTAIDVYIWLAYRLHALRGPTPVRWHALKSQFGEHYAKLSHFKPILLDALKLATAVYPDAKVEITDEGVTLHPSRPPIDKKLIEAK